MRWAPRKANRARSLPSNHREVSTYHVAARRTAQRRLSTLPLRRKRRAVLGSGALGIGRKLRRKSHVAPARLNRARISVVR
jgi:hypothetical protein